MKKLFVIPALLAIIEPTYMKPAYAETSDSDTEYSANIPDGYPLESAEYYDYADCVNENPDDSVDCVTNKYGNTYAVAPFPTTEQKDSSWGDLAEAWSQVGTIKKLTIDVRGNVSVYNPKKPIPRSVVCEYEFREYYDYYTCTEPED